MDKLRMAHALRTQAAWAKNNNIAEMATFNDEKGEAEEASDTATAEEAPVLTTMELKDEVCSDASYLENKVDLPATGPPATVAVAPPPPSRGLGGVDYYLLTYEDPSDSD